MEFNSSSASIKFQNSTHKEEKGKSKDAPLGFPGPNSLIMIIRSLEPVYPSDHLLCALQGGAAFPDLAHGSFMQKNQ